LFGFAEISDSDRVKNTNHFRKGRENFFLRVSNPLRLINY